MYDKICKNCGTRLSAFYHTSMLGCPECYKAFEEEIISALKKIQGRTFHAGKTPKLSKLDKELLLEYDRLVAEKERATIEGRFFDIKGLSEQILDLLAELKSRGLK